MNALDNARPMRFGEVLDFTFRIFRNRFKVLTLLTLLLWGFFLFIEQLLDIQSTFADQMDDFGLEITLITLGVLILLVVILLLGYIFVQPILDIAITNIALKEFSNQQIGSVREALQGIKGKIGKAIGTNFILNLFLLIGAFLVGIPFILILISTGTIGFGMDFDFEENLATVFMIVIFTLLLIIILLIPIFYFTTRFSLYFPIIAAENIGYLQALGRSWELTRSAFWRIFGLYLLLGLLVTVYYYVVGFIVAIPTLILLVMNIPGVFFWGTILAIFASIALCIPYSLVPIVSTLIYVDRRATREGEDMKTKLSEWQKDGQSEGELPVNDRV